MEDAPAKNNSMVLIIVALIITLGGGYYFYTQKPSGNQATTRTNTTAVAVMQGDVKVFTLEGGSFYFKPNVIEVKKGDKVKVVLNSVSMMHDFVIDELNVKSAQAKSGTSTSVEFVADKVGSFEFYCSVGEHRAQGMVGTLVVAE